MKLHFIRDNPALAAGIGLPVVVVILFALASEMPGWFVARPRYDAVFAVDFPFLNTHGPVTGEVRYEVKGVHLRALRRFVTRDDRAAGQYENSCLYLFDSRTLRVREIAVPVTATPDEGVWHEIPVPQVRSLILDTLPQSPDGYQLHDRRGQGGGFWPLFDRVPPRETLFLEKNEREIRLQLPDSCASTIGRDDVHFLGWVIGRNS